MDNHLLFRCTACILSRQVSKGNWTESNKYVPLVAQPNYFGGETVQGLKLSLCPFIKTLNNSEHCLAKDAHNSDLGPPIWNLQMCDFSIWRKVSHKPNALATLVLCGIIHSPWLEPAEPPDTSDKNCFPQRLAMDLYQARQQNTPRSTMSQKVLYRGQWSVCVCWDPGCLGCIFSGGGPDKLYWDKILLAQPMVCRRLSSRKQLLLSS